MLERLRDGNFVEELPLIMDLADAMVGLTRDRRSGDAIRRLDWWPAVARSGRRGDELLRGEDDVVVCGSFGCFCCCRMRRL